MKQLFVDRLPGPLPFLDRRSQLVELVLRRGELFARLLHIAQAELFGLPLLAEAGQLMPQRGRFLFDFGQALAGMLFGFIGQLPGG